jgi:hypothetical protein
MFEYCWWKSERIEVCFVESQVNIKDRDDVRYNEDLNEPIGMVKKDIKKTKKNVGEKEEINHHKTFSSFFRNDTPIVGVKIRKKDE